MHRPTIMQSTPQGTIATTGLSNPICDTQGLPIVGYPDISTSIANLLMFGSPFAVVWLIISIVVDTLQRVARCGLLPHIFIEWRECKPLRTNPDSSGIIIPMCFWVTAFNPTAPHHIFPALVFGQMTHAMSSTIWLGFLYTSTSLRMSSPQITRKDFYLGTTVTTAKPFGGITALFFGARYFCYYQIPCETITNLYRIALSHAIHPIREWFWLGLLGYFHTSAARCIV